MEYTLYLDNSNVFIEGQKVSAVRKRMAKYVGEKDARGKQIHDTSYRLDFGKLIQITCGFQASVNKAKLYGSRPPTHDTVWDMAKEKGFELIIFDKSYYGKEKKVDSTIVMNMTEDVLINLDPKTDQIVLIAGDADFIPVVQRAKQKGFSVKVAFWNHASHELKQEASEFQNLDSHLNDLSYYRGKK